MDFYYRKPVVGYCELVLGTDYTVSNNTITWLRSLNVGERVYASYDVTVTDSTFSLPSVRDIALLGSAAELGSRLYSEGTQEWKLVTQYAERYKEWLDRITKGVWIPDELRALNYWKDVETSSNPQISSVRVYRG